MTAPSSGWKAQPHGISGVSAGRCSATASTATLGPETTLGTQPVTTYIAYNPTTNTLVEHTRGFDNGTPLNFDPLTVVRNALAAGTAHLDGRTVIDGERAIQITLTIRDLDGHTGTVIYLADAKTYHPIEIKYDSLEAFSYPLEPIFRPHGDGLASSQSLRKLRVPQRLHAEPRAHEHPRPAPEHTNSSLQRLPVHGHPQPAKRCAHHLHDPVGTRRQSTALGCALDLTKGCPQDRSGDPHVHARTWR